MRVRGFVAAAVLAAASAAAHAQLLINQGFDNVAGLAASGWILSNQSSPIGTTGWFQGDQTQFPAQGGASSSYIAANYNNAAAAGTIANWLITPTFSSSNAVTVSFYARSAGDAGYIDQLRFGFSSGGSSFADFALGAPQVIAGGDWTRYTFSYAAHGAGSLGRFAIVYSEPADAADYVGVDTFTVAVPEPETWAMLTLGMVTVGWIGRRRTARG